MNVMPRARLRRTAAAAAIAALAFAAPASGAIIGQKNLSNDDGALTCPVDTCTHAFTKVPDGDAAAPFRGRIVSWRVSVSTPHDSFTNTGPLRLQVLKRIVDEPGIANDEFAAVRETDELAATPGVINKFAADLKIRKGQFIGLSSNDTTEIREADRAKSNFLNWSDALIPGGLARAPDVADGGRFVLFNARLVKNG
jgi:hypothetical protein